MEWHFHRYPVQPYPGGSSLGMAKPWMRRSISGRDLYCDGHVLVSGHAFRFVGDGSTLHYLHIEDRLSIRIPAITRMIRSWVTLWINSTGSWAVPLNRPRWRGARSPYQYRRWRLELYDATNTGVALEVFRVAGNRLEVLNSAVDAKLARSRSRHAGWPNRGGRSCSSTRTDDHGHLSSQSPMPIILCRRLRSRRMADQRQVPSPLPGSPKQPGGLQLPPRPHQARERV